MGMKFCLLFLDVKGKPNERRTSVLMPIFKRKGDVKNCNAYR